MAAVLSAVVPGAGQLYLGKRRKALAIFALLIATSIGFWLLRLPRSYSNLVLLIWVLLALSMYAVYEALLGRDIVPSARLSKWWIVGAIPLHFIGSYVLFTSLFFASGFRTAMNLGSSMEPTLVNRERFIYDTAYYRSRPRRRGDVVILHYRDSLFIKRIAAVGGDTIEGRQQQILLNGQPLSASLISRKFPMGDVSEMPTFASVTVESGKYFVLGDNLDLSFDSRAPSFGLVDEKAIVGKALYSYQFTGTQLSRRLD